MKWLLPLCLVPCFALAAEPPQFEAGISPSLSYSTNDRFQFSTGVFFKIPVAHRWQLKLADENLVSNRDGHRFLAGVDYNFNDDWQSSFFAGLGAGWQKLGIVSGSLPKNYWFGYAEAGKRFTLIRSWGLSYAPQVQLNWGPDSNPEVRIMPANVSLFF